MGCEDTATSANPATTTVDAAVRKRTEVEQSGTMLRSSRGAAAHVHEVAMRAATHEVGELAASAFFDARRESSLFANLPHAKKRCAPRPEPQLKRNTTDMACSRGAPPFLALRCHESSSAVSEND